MKYGKSSDAFFLFMRNDCTHLLAQLPFPRKIIYIVLPVNCLHAQGSLSPSREKKHTELIPIADISTQMASFDHPPGILVRVCPSNQLQMRTKLHSAVKLLLLCSYRYGWLRLCGQNKKIIWSDVTSFRTLKLTYLVSSK